MQASPISESHVPAITEKTFDAEVLGAKEPVLVDFTAEWCPPCRALAPILRELSVEQAGRLKVVTVDGDAEAALAARYRIKAFPTVVAFAGGQEVARHVGLTTKARLAKMVLGEEGREEAAGIRRSR